MYNGGEVLEEMDAERERERDTIMMDRPGEREVYLDGKQSPFSVAACVCVCVCDASAVGQVVVVLEHSPGRHTASFLSRRPSSHGGPISGLLHDRKQSRFISAAALFALSRLAVVSPANTARVFSFELLLALIFF